MNQIQFLVLFIIAQYAVGSDPTYGGSPTRPGSSCQDILVKRGSASNGIYYIYSDSAANIIPVFCDFQTDAGVGWTLVHKLSDAVVGNALNMWTSGTPINQQNTSVLNVAKNAHYLNSLINDWGRVDKISVRLYTGGNIVRRLDFFPRTNKLDWFSPPAVNYSSWSDLPTAANWEGSGQGRFFSINGYAPDSRTWYINNNWGGCGADQGWMIVSYGSDTCNFEFFGAKTPVRIVHSGLATLTQWSVAKQYADTFAIFVKLRDGDCGSFPNTFVGSNGNCSFCAGPIVNPQYSATTVTVTSDCFYNNTFTTRCKFGSLITDGSPILNTNQVECPIPPMTTGTYQFTISLDGGVNWLPSCSKYIATPTDTPLNVTDIVPNLTIPIEWTVQSGSSVNIYLMGYVDPTYLSKMPSPASQAVDSNKVVQLMLIAGNVSNTGIYNWVVPGSIPDAKAYAFKIEFNSGNRRLIAGIIFSYVVTTGVQAQCHGTYCGLQAACAGQNGTGNPIDPVDVACRSHDQCYDRSGRFDPVCDQKLIDDLKAAIPTCPNTDCSTYGAKAVKLFSAILSIRGKGQKDETEGTGPVGTTGGHGDPHYTTVDNCYYTFNGVGEYTLLGIQGTFDTQFISQVRTERVQIFPASMHSAITMRTGASGSRVGLYAKGADADLYIDSIKTVLLIGCPHRFTGGQITKREIGTYFVDFDNGVSVNIATDNFVADRFNRITLNFPYSLAFNQTYGILGVWDNSIGNDISLRNGTTLSCSAINNPNIFRTFADSWKILDSESLFDYDFNVTTANYTNTSFVPPFTPQFQSPAQEQLANQLCAGVPPEFLNACLFDFALINNTSVIGAIQNTNDAITAATKFPVNIRGFNVYAGNSSFCASWDPPSGVLGTVLYDVEYLTGSWVNLVSELNGTTFCASNLINLPPYTLRLRSLLSNHYYSGWTSAQVSTITTTGVVTSGSMTTGVNPATTGAEEVSGAFFVQLEIFMVFICGVIALFMLP